MPLSNQAPTTDQQFAHDIYQCFVHVISPSIGEIIDTLNAAGHTAFWSPAIQRTTHAHSIRTLIFSVFIGGHTMQLDVTSNKETQQLELTFRFKPNTDLDISYTSTLQDATKENIQAMIFQNLRKIEE